MTLDVLLLVVCGISALAVLVLGVFGVRGTRIDDHPCCRRCGFDLSGLSIEAGAARCPECGRIVGGVAGRSGVRIGRRRAHPVAAWAGLGMGLLVTLPTGVVGGLLWSGADLDHYKPVWLLLVEGGSTRSATSQNARSELRRRLVLGEISPAGARSVAIAALERQAGPEREWDPEWGTLFEIAWLGGWLDDDDGRRYEQQAVAFVGVVGGPAGADGSVTLELEASDRTGDLISIRTHARLTIPQDWALRATMRAEFNVSGLLGPGSLPWQPITPGMSPRQWFESLGIPPEVGAGLSQTLGVVPAMVVPISNATTAPGPMVLRVAPWPTERSGPRQTARPELQQRLVGEPGTDAAGLRLTLHVWTSALREQRFSGPGLSSWWSQRPVPVVPTRSWPAERVDLELLIQRSQSRW